MGRASRGISLQEVQAAERARVEAILDRDRADRSADHLRQAAQVEVAEGRFVNLADAVEQPTPEQFAQAERSGGGFRKFTPRQPDETVRTVTAYRRKELPQVQRLVLSGVIDTEGFRDCLWYRNLYEETGLTGNFGSTDYGREVFTHSNSRGMFTDRQAEQQDEYRAVRSLIESSNLSLLDQVVLEDVPIWRAARSSGAGWRNARRIFTQAVDQLGSARDMLKPES